MVQVGIFSATLPPDALEITRKFMNKPVRRPPALTCQHWFSSMHDPWAAMMDAGQLAVAGC